ncbi:MAG TPA: amidohydrolase family protein [Steroidobacteraceae bacterium]|nr:amidohydrolase family protein [Steroidobacteraceae bacterium]
MRRVLALAAALLLAGPALAETLLIRNATVHTMTAAGTLESADILLRDGTVAAVGRALEAPSEARVIDAQGQPVTPGFFGGLTHLGLEEIGLEPTAEDGALQLGTMRPEFDVALAFNPASVSIVVSRVEGVTFAVIAPSAEAGRGDAPGGTIIAGQGAVIALDGGAATHSRALFLDFGADANELSGGSRAAQYMLLKQAFLEARTPNVVLADDQRLLTPAGRQALLDFIGGAGVFVFDIDRAADIRQVLAFAAREKLRVAIAGGAEAWRVAGELAAARVPVILDALEDLPGGFDSIGATLENAARLQRAGVKVAFTMDSAEPHNVRKLRQTAGNAVAHGLPWEAALAGLTRVPAEIFGVSDRFGTIERGRRANLVVWSGDPLEVTSFATHVFIDGALQPDRSRQTELRDRYLERVRAGTAR